MLTYTKLSLIFLSHLKELNDSEKGEIFEFCQTGFSWPEIYREREGMIRLRIFYFLLPF